MRRFVARPLVTAAFALVASFAAESEAFANTAPTCSNSSPVAVDFKVHFDGTLCSDPDGDALTYSVIDWPTGGSLVGDPSTGIADYTAYFETLEDSFTFRVSDGQLLSNIATVTITVPAPPGGNRPPACPSSDVFVAVGEEATMNGNCVDPEGDPLSYALTSTPGGGVFSVFPPATVKYTPDGSLASTSFGYTAKDIAHSPVPATVFINIVSGSVFETAAEASPAEPFVAAIDSPNGGPVVIDTRAVSSPPRDGFLLLGQEFDIHAPAGSLDEPLRLTFKVDGSAAPPGRVEVFRDIETSPDPIPDCDAGGVTTNDPCVLSRTGTAPDDIEVTVLSTHASRWNLAVGPHDFAGFYSPVNNLPTLNEVAAGRAVPVKFGLGGDQGLGVIAPTYPRSEQVACSGNVTVDGIESTVTSGASALTYDASTDRYQYVWKTDRAWSGTCRQLVLKLSDGSKHRANFKFR